MPFKDPEKQRESSRKYQKSAKGRATKKLWDQTEKGKETNRAKCRRYYWRNREAQIERVRRYQELHPPVRMFGEKVYMPDKEFAEFAVRLREQRKEALSGR